jgi:hypothetical protein
MVFKCAHFRKDIVIIALGFSELKQLGFELRDYDVFLVRFDLVWVEVLQG